MKKILITDPIDIAGLEILSKDFNVVEKYHLDFAALKNEIKDCDAVITRSETAVTQELLNIGKKIKVVGRAGIGIDNIDIKAAGNLGIPIINAPTGNALAAAEHTMGLIFALARKIPRANELLKKGVWAKHELTGIQLKDKTLGIVGLGRVGTEVARMARGVGMKIIACDPFKEELKARIPLVFLEDLLQKADIITIHTPLTKLTNDLIGEKQLALLKKDALLINCARGEIVQERALYKILNNKEIQGAALDVFKTEPTTNNKLFELENTVVTPHIGAATKEAKRKTAEEIAKEIGNFFKGRETKNIVNKIYLNKGKRFFWKKFDKVVFDCDSTLTTIEGIDELAGFKNKYEEIKELTIKAMEGDMPFEEVFQKRLEAIRPTKKDLIKLGAFYLQNLTQGAKEVLAALRFLGIDVYLVTGGYELAIKPLTSILKVRSTNVFANKIIFDNNGQYQGFDKNQLLVKDDGKAQILKMIRRNNENVILIGDGMNDYQAGKETDLFVGFGGVAKRKMVQHLAPIYIKCQDLTPFLIIAAGKDGCDQLVDTEYKVLLQKGLTNIFCKRGVIFKDRYDELKQEIKNYFLEEGI